ncbi:jg20264 [Pararge aegeria aegeria]|uniref:Jg20264 protein n=1 Tax=Pararge aegeria aegeria TaxID=348720 RepID=A0A8S4R3E9_9NEOP|nr:jg20264 [Pararge aegeria aegeria]
MWCFRKGCGFVTTRDENSVSLMLPTPALLFWIHPCVMESEFRKTYYEKHRGQDTEIAFTNQMSRPAEGPQEQFLSSLG